MSESYNTVVLVVETYVHQISLRAMLDSTDVLQVVGTANGCLTALSMVQEIHPDFVLIEGNFLEPEIITFLHAIRESELKTRVVVLRRTPWHRSQLLDAGANAVLGQDSNISELLAAFASQLS